MVVEWSGAREKCTRSGSYELILRRAYVRAYVHTTVVVVVVVFLKLLATGLRVEKSALWICVAPTASSAAAAPQCCNDVKRQS